MVENHMQIYSETLYAFTQKCLLYLREIIANETDLELRRTRFLFNKHTYPLVLITFENDSKIGYFDQASYQIGLNSKLSFTAKENVLKDILRHEFAHYLTMINFGNVKAHGDEFKSICKKYGWEKSISKATLDINLANDLLEGDLKSEKLIAKVKNLLKLASSDNEHEAHLATTKANQLILKHNLSIYSSSEDTPIYTKTIMTEKRKSSKMSSIYSILTHFLVTPVMNYTSDGVRLEITGTKTNIEIGEYVCSFLLLELDRLWMLEKEKSNLKGLRQKNSFFLGVAQGYEQKIKETQSHYSQEESKSLVLIKADLKEKTDKIYGRLRGSYSNSAYDDKSASRGRSHGKRLSINEGIKKNSNKLIGWLR